MSPRTGRPKIENPKSKPIHVRLDNECSEILEKYCEQESIAKTEGIRRGIQKLRSEIKKIERCPSTKQNNVLSTTKSTKDIC